MKLIPQENIRDKIRSWYYLKEKKNLHKQGLYTCQGQENIFYQWFRRH